MKIQLSRILPLAAAVIFTANAQAQGGFGVPGGVPMSPAAQAKMQAWRQWRDNHKNVAALQHTLGALTQMEQDPRTRLTKPQAKAILAVIRKWQGKPALTDDQARLVNQQMTQPLTLIQIKKIAMMSQARRGGRPGGFGGQGGGQGGRPGFDPAAMPAPRDYNPLNPGTQPMPRARDHARQQHIQLMTALLASAK